MTYSLLIPGSSEYVLERLAERVEMGSWLKGSSEASNQRLPRALSKLE